MSKPVARGKGKIQKVSHQITFPSTVQRSLGVCPAHLSPEGSSGQWRGVGGVGQTLENRQCRSVLTSLEAKDSGS